MTSPRPIEVVDTRGELPRFWNMDAVFFGNLLGLFFGNDSEMHELKETVGEVDSYGGRMVPILSLLFQGEHNTLVLEHHTADELCRYFSEDLRLRLPELRLLTHAQYEAFGRELAAREGTEVSDPDWLRAYRGHPAERVDGYVTDETLLAIASRLGKPTITTREGCWRGNNKLELHRFLEQAGLPVVATALARSADEVPAALEALRKRGFESAVLKSQIGASGIGMLKWPDLGEVNETRLAQIPAHFFYEGEVMVQGWITPGRHGVMGLYSPSIQLFVDDERVSLYDVTEQILSHDSIHEGNVSPPPYLAKRSDLREELFRQAERVGTWLHEAGYRGTGSVDFLLAEREGRTMPDVYVCEVNARVTGATYPSVLARHFTPKGAWVMRNLRLSTPLEEGEVLEMLRRPGHLFLPDRDRGVLPINLNYGDDELVHKGQFLCLAPTGTECFGYLEAAERDLPVQWETDRD